MNALRFNPSPRACRSAAVALLALLALFTGSLRGLAFTNDDLAGQWDFEIFYSNQPGVPVDITYTLEADGTVKSIDLAVGSYVISGVASDHFVMTLPAGPAYFIGTIESAGRITGTVDVSAFNPGVTGTFTATRGGAAIAVELADGTRLASGTGTVDFGNGFTAAARPAIAKVKLLIKNTGTSPLNISDAAVSSGPFRITAKPGKKVAGGGKTSTSLTLQMTPNDPIRFDGNPPVPTAEEGRLLIYSDDPGTPIFRIKLTGQTGGFSPQ